MAFQVTLYLLKASTSETVLSLDQDFSSGTGIEKEGSKLTLNPHESTDTSRFYLLNQDLKVESWTHVPHALSLPGPLSQRP